MSGSRQQANRGRVAEELVRLANADYRRRGVAIVEKVPTEWLPLRGFRDGTYRIVSAKVSRPAIVDFLGCWDGRGLAFDVKEWSGSTWWLRRLEPHQAEFLASWHRAGGIAFVLLVEHQSLRANLLPWEIYARAWEAKTQGLGRASIATAEIRSLPECPAIPGNPCHYLAAWEEAKRRGLVVTQINAESGRRLVWPGVSGRR